MARKPKRSRKAAAKAAAPRVTKPKSTKPQPKEKQICFVLTPFGRQFEKCYERVYKPAIEDAGLSPRRVDDLYRPGTIVSDIWNLTQTAKLLLADLTGRNPNVFYELGLAHALAKPVILVTDSIEHVPFDLRALRVLDYNKDDPRWGESLREKITTAIQQVLAAPLEAVLPAFLKAAKRAKPQVSHLT